MKNLWRKVEEFNDTIDPNRVNRRECHEFVDTLNTDEETKQYFHKKIEIW